MHIKKIWCFFFSWILYTSKPNDTNYFRYGNDWHPFGRGDKPSQEWYVYGNNCKRRRAERSQHYQEVEVGLCGYLSHDTRRFRCRPRDNLHPPLPQEPQQRIPEWNEYQCKWCAQHWWGRWTWIHTCVWVVDLLWCVRQCGD